MDNVALAQILQFLVLLFYLWLAIAVCRARVNLPKTKCEPILDILLVVILLIYAITFKIIFST